VIWKNNSIPNVARAGAGDSVDVTISNIKDEFGNGLLDPGGNYTVLVTPSQPCMVGVSANRDVDTSKRHAGGGLESSGRIASPTLPALALATQRTYPTSANLWQRDGAIRGA
jgi:hypothetical protein